MFPAGKRTSDMFFRWTTTRVHSSTDFFRPRISCGTTASSLEVICSLLGHLVYWRESLQSRNPTSPCNVVGMPSNGTQATRLRYQIRLFKAMIPSARNSPYAEEDLDPKRITGMFTQKLGTASMPSVR